jgi:hypothetical protein
MLVYWNCTNFLKCAFHTGFLNCGVFGITVKLSGEMKLFLKCFLIGSLSAISFNKYEKFDKLVAQTGIVYHRVEHELMILIFQSSCYK